MHAISGQLTRWLNVLLVMAMLAGLLPPAPVALAASLRSDAKAPAALEMIRGNVHASLSADPDPQLPNQAAPIAIGERPFDSPEARAASLVPAQLGPTTFLGPTPYLSEANSPFEDLLGLADFYLENFEDGSLNTPGVSISAIGACITPPCFSGLTDSVDADDGAIDGSGLNGHNLWVVASAGVTFTFDPTVLGGWPTRVGVVWTDGGVGGTTTFEAFDINGVSLGTRSGSTTDGNYGGGTGEDRFYGVIYPAGISKIHISDTGGGGMEVDHFQYGQPIASSFPDSGNSPNECPITECKSGRTYYVGDPINTFSGNYNYQVTDLSIPTVGQSLRFERSYNSLPVTGTVVYSRPLGYGWTHNYDVNLTLPDDPGGEPDMVILKAAHGSRLRFIDNGDGTYDAYPGVWATMTRQGSVAPYTYVITAANQTVYTFGLLTNSVVVQPIQATPSLSLTLSPNYQVAAAPGTVLTLTHRLTNTTATTDTYDIAAASPGNWLTVQPLTATLASSASITLTAFITAPQSYGRDAVVTATLTAASQTTPTLTATAVETLTLRGYRLLSTVDPQGNETDFDYDSSGYLGQVSDPTGQRYLNLGYDGQGRLASVTDHFSRSVGYGYDANNNLAVFTDTRHLAWTYTYTTAGGGAGTPHYLHAVTDPDSKVVERTFFDTQGRAVRQENGLGQPVAEITYLGNTSVITEAGKVMTDTYNAQGLWVGQVDALNQAITYTFDSSFNRNGVTDANGNPPTQYERDAFGLTHMITDAAGFTTTFSYDARNNLTQTVDARGNVTSYEYDTQNNLKKVINPPSVGGTTVYTYNTAGQVTAVKDENSNLTQYGYDSLGNRTVITDALTHITRYNYDSLGRVITTTDAKNKVTVNTYDAADNLIKMTENYLAGQPQNYQNEYNLITQYAYDGANRQIVITNTLGQVSRNIYDNAGRLEQTIENKHASVSTQNYLNEYNLTTTYGYDTFGRQIAITDTLDHVSRTEYDTVGRLYQTIVNYVNGAYDSAKPDEDIITRFEYDKNGNVTKTTLLPGSSEQRVSCTYYDQLNRVQKTVENCQDGSHSSDPPDVDLVTTYSYDAVGNQRVITNTRGYPTGYDYDALNRVITITNPLDDPTGYGYDAAGNRTRMTDAKGQTTTYVYDALNRVVTTTNDLSFSTAITYDEVGNHIRVVDANSNPLTYTYDSLYRVKTTTDAENQTTSVTYDALGNKLTVTDAETHVGFYEYNSLNRLITTTQNYVSGGPTNAETNVKTSVVYDALGRRTQSKDARGNLTSYGYDALGRTVAITDALTHVTRTTYDGLGNRRSMTNAETETTEFEYDGVNRLVLTRDPLNNETTFGYDEAGNRVQMMDAKSVVTRYGYDALDRLISVTENYVQSGPSDNVTNLATRYGYDKVGNRTVITDARSITLTYASTFTYDRLNRRTDMYDQVGHRTQYSYDKVGNTKVITNPNLNATGFGYDKVNRLTTINYADTTPDVTFTYDQVGNRKTMLDGTGTTTYTYDSLYRLTGVKNGANQTVGYGYDAAGNRTRLIYPVSTQVVTYTYDAANRLDVVTDWNNGQFGYDYDNANRLTGLTLPNTITSAYTYDDAGRLDLLTHTGITQTLASYDYGLDKVGNRTALTETLVAIQYLSAGAYLESGGQVVAEAENFTQNTSGLTRTWLTATAQSGYTGTAYMQTLPDLDLLYQTSEITNSPKLAYPINFTTPGTYTVWLRGYPTNAASDSAYAGFGDQVTSVTGFAPGQWSWARLTTSGITTTLSVTTSGLSTVTVWMREDGLRIDRLLLTTSTTFIPTGFGPTESARQTTTGAGPTTTLTHTIVYTYDNMYRLTNANYNTGETYAYSYDPVGNRLQQIINGNTTSYQYDAANRLAQVNGQSNVFDANGNLKQMGVMSNTFDAANRLITTNRATTTLQVAYNGVGDRVAQTTGATTTHLALDVQGLPEVMYTNSGESYLHLPGVIMTEKAGQRRYLLPDGLGSIRQVVDETAQVVAYNEFDPYGNPVNNTTGGEPYGYTGEWWASTLNLLHLRARWYAPETGTFLSRDRVESEPPYLYVRGNPVNITDSSGTQGPLPEPDPTRPECLQPLGADTYVPVPITCFLPPLPPPPSSPTPLFPPGFTEVVNAIIESHQRQSDDGIIFGFSGGVSSLLTQAGMNSPQSLNTFLVAFDDVCLPATGKTGGLEIVFDFKHQERGIFWYDGNLLNIGTIANGGVSAYIGKTRGFANTGYQRGVLAYSGPFVSGSFNLGYKGLPVGGAIIEAAPLNSDDYTLDRTGVFATYFGIGKGVSAGSPVNADIAVTNYIPLPGFLGRQQYVVGTLIAPQNMHVRRATVAALMTSEITQIALLEPGFAGFVPQAIGELWNFAGTP